MTKAEFAHVLKFLADALPGVRPLTADSVRAYHALLGDLPLRVFQLAAQKVALEHEWNTFPSPAELRRVAGEVVAEDVTPAEAWKLAWQVACQHDPETQGEWVSGGVRYPSRFAAVTAGMPQVVVEAVRSFGVSALCGGTEPVTVVRAQFLKLFEQVAAKQRRLALLPAPLRNQIAQARRGELAPPVAEAVKRIGRME